MIRPGIRRLFRVALRRSWLLAEDVDDEIRLHLELRTEQLARRGLTPAEARARAVQRFGPPDEARRRLLEAARHREDVMRTHEWFDALWSDLRYAARSLRRAPGLAAVVIITLALGIGANAAMFGVVDRLLLRGPAHVRDASRLVLAYLTYSQPGMGEFTSGTLGHVSYATLRDGTRSFDGVAAYSVVDATIGRGGDAEQIRAGYATWDFFPLLGVRPALGRFFGPEEDRPPRGSTVAVLDYGIWRRRFGGDPAILGRTITVGDEPYTVVGVAPKGFTGAELGRADLWIPMSIRSARTTRNWSTAWDAQWLRIVARLRPGVTRAQADADATAAHRRAYAGDDKAWAAARMRMAPVWSTEDGKESAEVAVARWLVGVSAVVLLIACANVTNLLLARAMRRRREVAVRLALGIGRARLVRLLLTEGLLLALAGGAAALAVAHWGGQFVRLALLPAVAWPSPPVDARVLAYTTAVAIATGVLVGLVPALQASRPNLTDALKAGTREGGGRHARLRAGLTVAQAALSAVLLVGAGLFVRSLWNVRALNLGLEPDRVVVVSIDWPSLQGRAEAEVDRERARRNAFVDGALDHVRRLAGVERVAVAIGTPFHSSFQQRLRVDGWDSLPAHEGGGPSLSAVTSDYFATVGTPLLRGRAFTPADRAAGAPRAVERVAVVNETMARTLWPNASPLGSCLYISTMPCSRVVGVVADARRFQLRESPKMQYYIPVGQEVGMGGRNLLVRPRGELAPMLPALRRELLRLDPGLPYVRVRPLQDAIDPQVRPWRLGATMFGIFGALALVVAAIGLYSLIAYGVAQRAHEMGVRVALGAQRRDIVRLVAGDGLRIAALGVAIGTAAALAAGRFVAPLLFDVSPTDRVTYAAVTLTLLAVALGASLVPARRATRVDPAAVLRAE